MYEAGSYVLGGEIEYSRLDFDGVGDDFAASVLRLKVRVGYDAGAILPYFTAGAARLTLRMVQTRMTPAISTASVRTTQ
jgi:hypothetical protein